MKEGIEVQNPTAWGVGTNAAALGTSGGATTFGSGATNNTCIFRSLLTTGGTIRGVTVNIVTATGSTTAVVFTCKVYPTPGSSTGARTVGTLTIAGSTDAAGDVWQRFSGLANTSVNPGEEVVVELTTKGSAATTANGYANVIIEPVFVGKMAQAAADQVKPYGSGDAVGTINTVVA
ncbi:MAG: hypothetical protein EBT79_09085 [Actinobacteria bacterium]|nr:hypothetical protein [Actinomycetota bacterium]NBR67407.1 hypothetical protein [Actinomycetota bacterium]